MSYSYALPGEHSSSGLSRRWLLACTLSQLICAAAIAAGGALAQRMQWLADAPEMIALNLTIAGIFGLTFGYLRGCVLREGLARFPLLAWCLAIAAVTFFMTPPVPSIIPDLTFAALAPAVFGGSIYGLLIGGVEAVVMRRAAFGLFAWTLLSGLAWALGVVGTTIGSTLTSAQLLPLIGGPGATLLWSLIEALIVAIVMLPALRVLKPRLSYYGPRVYRPLLQRNARK